MPGNTDKDTKGRHIPMQWKDRYRFKGKDRNMNLKLAEKKIRHTNKDTKERQIQIQSKDIKRYEGKVR